MKGIFERYLPYATAFGLEQQWVQTFKQANPPAPAWYDSGDVIVYHGPGHFDIPNVGGGSSSIDLPDLGALASVIPTNLPDLSGAGDAMGGGPARGQRHAHEEQDQGAHLRLF